jgi:hypothetical protein
MPKPADEELWGPRPPAAAMATAGAEAGAPADPHDDGQPGTPESEPSSSKSTPDARFGGLSAPIIAALAIGMAAIALVAVVFTVSRDANPGDPLATSQPGSSLTNSAALDSPVGSGVPALTEPIVTRGPATQRRATAVAVTQATTQSGPQPLSTIKLGSRLRLAAKLDGTLFVSDGENRVIYSIAPDNSTAEVVAGSRSGLAQVSSVLNDPGPVTVDSFGALLIADQPAPTVPGRLIRINPDGTSVVVLTDDRMVRHLYADDIGNVYAHFAPAEGSTEDSLVRLAPTGELSQDTIPSPFQELVPIAGGRWFGVDQQGQLQSVSLFGSAADLGAPILVSAPAPAVRPVRVNAIGSNLIVVRCTDTCDLAVHDAAGARTATASLGPVSDITSRRGAILVADSRGGLTSFPALDDLRRDRAQLVTPAPALTGDAVVETLAGDLELSPMSLAVSPSGTIYWIDSLPSFPTFYSLSPDRTLSRLQLPAEVTLPTELVASPVGLVVRSGPSGAPDANQLWQLPWESLSVGVPRVANALKVPQNLAPAKSLSMRGSFLYVLTDQGLEVSNLDPQVTTDTPPPIRGLPVRAAGIAVNPSGYAMVLSADGRTILGAYGREKVSRIAVSSLAPTTGENADPADAAIGALLGLPEDQFGVATSIVAIGPRRFVIADAAASRLSLLEPGEGDSWVVRKFVGTAPSKVNASPISQRIEQPKLLTTDRSISVETPALVFVTQGGVIKRMQPDGTVQTLAGGGQRKQTALGKPAGITFFASDTSKPNDVEILVADEGRHRVVGITSDGQLALRAGSGLPGQSIADLDAPTGLSGADGQLHIADTGNHRILTIDGSGLTRVSAGTGVGGSGEVPAPAEQVALNAPQAVLAVPDGRLVIADTGNNRVLLLNTDGTLVKLFTIRAPSGLALLNNNTVLVSARNDGQVFGVNLETGKTTVVAGDGILGYQGDGGPATGARFNAPVGVAVGPDGSTYIADGGNGAIRRVRPDGIVSTLTGGDGSFPPLVGVAIHPTFGLLFTAVDGRLFSINAAELDSVIPGWSNK